MSAEPRSKADDTKKSTESLGRTLRDILIVAIVLGGGVYWYYHRTQNETSANKLAKEAKDLLFKDNLARYTEAESKLKEVLSKYDASHAYSLAALAELNSILWAEQHIEDRKAAAEEYTAKAAKVTNNLAEEFSAKSLVGIEEGKAAEIENWLKNDVIEKGGGGSRIFVSLGKALRAQGKLEEARRAFKAAYDSDWRNPRYAMAMAESYFEDSDFNNAGQYYKKGLDSNSDHLGCRIGMARTFIRTKDQLDKAGQVIDVALKDEANLTPNIKARALVARSELKLTGGDADGALADADEAIKADAKYAYGYSAKGFALAVKKDPGAVAQFDKAIATDHYVAAFHYDAAHALIDNGLDSEKALSYLQNFPLTKDDRFYMRYGEAYKKLGKLDDAMAMYKKASEENPLNGNARLAMAQVLIDQKNPDEAMKILEEALTLQEFFPDANALKAKILLEKKDWQTAMESYATALVQWRQGKQKQREDLVKEIDDVKQLLIKAGQKPMAKVWEEQAGQLVLQ
jgi:tetratricopeptide (TPR) repeat protein